MSKAKKRSQRWHRSLAIMLSVALALGGLTLTGGSVVQAQEDVLKETSGPGGVVDPVLWLSSTGINKYDDRPAYQEVRKTTIARVQTTTDGTSGAVTSWFDQSAKENDATQNNENYMPIRNSADIQNLINFNTAMRFDGNAYLQLNVNKLPAGKEARTLVGVAQTETLDRPHYILSWGTRQTGKMIGLSQANDRGALSNYTAGVLTNEKFWEKGVPNELIGTFSDNEGGALYSKSSNVSNLYVGDWDTEHGGARVGSLPTENHYTWEGLIGDVIVFDRILTSTERLKLSSYLSIRYGYTLDNGNYMSADGSIVWARDENSHYSNNIAGIGRDDVGGLLQKQSHSTNSGHQVVISSEETLSRVNSSNVGNLKDQQYLLWGDNGASLAREDFTIQVGNSQLNRAERVWKAQSTNGLEEALVAIPRAAIPANAVLIVADDENFTIGTVAYELESMEIEYAASNTLLEYLGAKNIEIRDGQYFTFAAPSPMFEQATIDLIRTDSKQVVLTFDQDVLRTDLSGLTIKAGDDPIIPTASVVQGNKIVLTLPEDTNITTAPLTVTYNAASGNFRGTNGIPVNDIASIIEIKLLNITEPAKSTFYGDDFPLAIAGEVAPGSTVTASVYNNENELIIPLIETNTTVTDSVYTWASTSPISGPFRPGDYELHVTATNVNDESKSSTIIKSFTIPQLELVNVAVNEQAHNEAVLTFNQPIDQNLTVGDLDGLTIDGRKVIGVEPVPGDNRALRVVLDKGAGASDPLLVEYSGTSSGIHADRNPLNGLLPISEDDQGDISASNGVVPLELVSAYEEDGQLKLVFNKPINDDADLSGFTFGGEPLQAPFAIDGNTLTVTLPDDRNGHVLAYDPEDGNISEKGNANNSLSSMQPGIDLGEGLSYLDDKGKLDANGIGLVDSNGNAVTMSPAPGFDPNRAGVYESVVPNDVESIDLNLGASQPGTATRVSLNGVDYSDVDLDNLPLEEGLNTIVVDIVDEDNPAIVLGQYKVEVIRATGKLGAIETSPSGLVPEFDPEITAYELAVRNSARTMEFSLEALDPGATIEMIVNGGNPNGLVSGEWSESVALKVGKNEIQFIVTDSDGKLTNYEVTVTRARATGGSGGGGTMPPETETIEVDVAIGGDRPVDVAKIQVERSTDKDGNITDQVLFTQDTAEETVRKAKATGEKIARVLIPDANDEVSKVNVDIPVEAARLLAENGIDLEIYTDNVMIRIPNASLTGIEEDFYFRLVPVKDPQERSEIEERARIESIVREVAGDNNIDVVARPMTIETNLSSRPVTVTLPLRDVVLPQEQIPREKFLNSLGVFIEHSDGDKEVVFGDIVKMTHGQLGIQFSINKFSTFTIIHYSEEGEHAAYIKGFPDGEFKPKQGVTRAQVALMIARNMGYTENGAATQTTFPDVSKTHFAAGAIEFVNEAKIMVGDPKGHFQADATITRAEMATVLANFKQLDVKSGVPSTFTDTSGHWAQWIIEASGQAGLVTGYENGQYRPNGSITREEAVTMINRALERGPLHGVTIPSFPDVSLNDWAFGHIEEAATDHSYFIDNNGYEQINTK